MVQSTWWSWFVHCSSNRCLHSEAPGHQYWETCFSVDIQTLRRAFLRATPASTPERIAARIQAIKSILNNLQGYGGGYSPERTTLRARFPAIREKYRDFSRVCPELSGPNGHNCLNTSDLPYTCLKGRLRRTGN